MRVSALQENVKKAIAAVGRAVAGKATLPVLGNILLATDRGRLKLAATNLEIGITCWIGAKIEEEGAVTVPAKLLGDVIGGLPNDRVTFDLDPRTVTTRVACARFTSNIKGIEAEEFPVIPTVADVEPALTLPVELLREVLDQVAFAAADDDSRPVLAGVLIRLHGRTAIFAATDGYRLSKRTIAFAEPVATAQEWIVPARALIELSRILADAEGTVEITVTPSGGQVLFHTEMTDLTSRLIDGKFPDFERIIPTAYTTRSVFDTQEVIKAVKLASFFANASQSIVKCTLESGGEIGPGKLVISANAAEVGDNTGEVDGMIHGEGGEIALNVRYLADALAAMKTPQVAMETQTPRSPGVFKPVGHEGYIHLVMPMGIR